MCTPTRGWRPRTRDRVISRVARFAGRSQNSRRGDVGSGEWYLTVPGRLAARTGENYRPLPMRRSLPQLREGLMTLVRMRQIPAMAALLLALACGGGGGTGAADQRVGVQNRPRGAPPATRTGEANDPQSGRQGPSRRPLPP